jgi:hypothetical protein
MAVYLRDIQVKAYTNKGEPTCRSPEGICVFYRQQGFGTKEVCGFDATEIYRSDNAAGVPNLGYTIVNAGCPVWATKVIKE